MAKWLFLVALSCFMERSWEYRSRLISDVENGNHQLQLFISEGHSKLQSQERKCEPLRGCANWQFCYIKSRGSKLHLHLQVKGTTRTCEVEPVQNKLVSNTAILRSLPKLLPEAVCFMVHRSTVLKSSPLAIIRDDSPMYILLSAHRVILYIEQKQKD